MRDQINTLGKVLQRLTEARFKVNTGKTLFGKIETEYLGFWESNNGLRPLSHKIESIKKFDLSTKVHNIRRFIGIVNYCTDMWH